MRQQQKYICTQSNAPIHTIGQEDPIRMARRGEPVDMWRIVERKKLEDGTGITASRLLMSNNLGNVEKFDDTDHYKSHHEQRLGDTMDSDKMLGHWALHE